jgi:hypothetical protein
MGAAGRATGVFAWTGRVRARFGGAAHGVVQRMVWGTDDGPETLRRLLAAIENERLAASDRHREVLAAIELLRRAGERPGDRPAGTEAAPKPPAQPGGRVPAGR